MTIFSKPFSIEDSCTEYGHTWNPSCISANLDVSYEAIKYSLKLYTSVYVVTGLLGKKGRSYFLKKAWKEILQSSVFLTSVVSFQVFFFCLLRKVFGRFYMVTSGLLPGIISSFFAIQIERKKRRGLLAVYTANIALEVLYNILMEAQLISPMPCGDVLLFSVSMSSLMYFHSLGSVQDGFVKSVLEFFLQSRKCKEYEVAETSLSHFGWLSHYLNKDLPYYIECCRVSCKAFVTGYCARAVPKIVLSLPNLLKNPRKLVDALVAKSNWQLGMFLATYVWIYKVLMKVLARVRKTEDSLNSAISGGVAGISMLWERSSKLSVYIATKTCEIAYMHGINKGMVPSFKNFDAVLYALSTGIILHGVFVQPHMVGKSYYDFVLRLTGGKLDLLNRNRMDIFGTQSSKLSNIS